jgi:tetratricopeptide (TPR) repeat protein
LAEALSQSGRHSEAHDVIAKLKEDFPNAADVYVTSARHKIRADRDGSGALEDLERARQLDPTAQRAMEVARLQVQLRQVDVAIKDLRAWVSRHPDQPAARRFLGELLLADNRYDEAASVYEGVLEAGQDDVSLRNNLAWALTKAGRPDDALEHAKKAVEGAPDSPDVLDTYGAALLAADRPEEAVAQLEAARAALEARPDGALTPDIAFNLVDALLATGDKTRAKEVLRALESQDIPKDARQKIDQYRSEIAD